VGVPTAMKDRLGALHGFGQIAGEGQPPGLDVSAHQVVKPRFIDRDLARVRASSILAGSRSTHTTSWPKSEKQTPETSPT
jgi:hypothetical protein